LTVELHRVGSFIHRMTVLPKHRILHLSTQPTWRGGEQQLYYLIRELRLRGFHQHTVCREGGALLTRLKQETLCPVTPIRSSILNPLTVACVHRAIQHCNPTVVHAHDAKAHSLALLTSVVLRHKVPIVVSRCVNFAIGQSALSRYKYRHRLIRGYSCVSDAVRNTIQPYLGNEVHLEVVYCGIPQPAHAAKRSGLLRTQLGLSENIRLIGTASALDEAKDLTTFLSAAQHICSRQPNVHFVIMGEGPLRSSLEHYATSLGLGNNVSFVGFIHNVPELMPDLDVFMFTSRSEGLGTVVLESMAAGVPVASTCVGGIPEFIHHGHTGLLSEPGDAESIAGNVETILTNREVRTHLIDKALRRVADFSVAALADNTIRLYGLCDTTSLKRASDQAGTAQSD